MIDSDQQRFREISAEFRTIILEMFTQYYVMHKTGRTLEELVLMSDIIGAGQDTSNQILSAQRRTIALACKAADEDVPLPVAIGAMDAMLRNVENESYRLLYE